MLIYLWIIYLFSFLIKARLVLHGLLTGRLFPSQEISAVGMTSANQKIYQIKVGNASVHTPILFTGNAMEDNA